MHVSDTRLELSTPSAFTRTCPNVATAEEHQHLTPLVLLAGLATHLHNSRQRLLRRSSRPRPSLSFFFEEIKERVVSLSSKVGRAQPDGALPRQHRQVREAGPPDRCRLGGASRARAIANRSIKSMASRLQRPPISRATTTNLHLSGVQSTSAPCQPWPHAHDAVHHCSAWARKSCRCQSTPERDVHRKLSPVEEWCS